MFEKIFYEILLIDFKRSPFHNYFNKIEVFLANQKNMKAGSEFEAKILLVPYDTIMNNIEFYVDDELIPVENNLGIYRETFTSSGKKKIKGNVKYNSVYSYQELNFPFEFEVEIQK